MNALINLGNTRRTLYELVADSDLQDYTNEKAASRSLAATLRGSSGALATVRANELARQRVRTRTDGGARTWTNVWRIGFELRLAARQ